MNDDTPRRRCGDCRRNKPATAAHFYVKGHYMDGRPKWDTYCRPCRRARTKARYVAVMADPESAEAERGRMRENRRAYRKRHPDRELEARRARWERIKADPERHEKTNARRRAWVERNREWLRVVDRITRGREDARRVSTAFDAYKPAPAGTHSGPMLDAGPLAEWLRFEFASWPLEHAARRLGVDEATVRRLMSGHAREVSLHIADRMFVHADCTHLLALLYPLDEDHAVRRPAA